MKCPQALRHIDEYVRGNLSAELSGDILHHLRACASCAEEECRSRLLAEGLPRLRKTAPPGLAARVMPPKIHRAIWWTPALAASLIVGLILFGSDREKDIPAPAPPMQAPPAPIPIAESPVVDEPPARPAPRTSPPQLPREVIAEPEPVAPPPPIAEALPAPPAARAPVVQPPAPAERPIAREAAPPRSFSTGAKIGTDTDFPDTE